MTAFYVRLAPILREEAFGNSPLAQYSGERHLVILLLPRYPGERHLVILPSRRYSGETHLVLLPSPRYSGGEAFGTPPLAPVLRGEGSGVRGVSRDTLVRANNSNSRDRARELRRALTPAERILWSALRGRRFADYKFRRQHPFGRYVFDFYCARARPVVEVDGESHLVSAGSDQRRSIWLESQGLRVVRYWNTDVYDDFEAVLTSIWETCQAIVLDPSPPTPLPGVPGRGEKRDRPSAC